MDLDEMRKIWSAQEAKLDASLRLNARLLSTLGLERVQPALHRLRRQLSLELALNLAATVLLGAFWGSEWGAWRFVIPGALLHLCAVLLVVSTGRQMAMAWDIDPGAPVAEAQRKLGALRVLRVRTTQMVLLAAPALWVPVLTVALRALLGVDAYAVLDGTWIAANVLFGLTLIPLALWAARRYAGRLQGSPLLQRLMEDLVGHSLNAAMRSLRQAQDFQSETAAGASA
jgi:hypothetical protein